MNGKLKIQLAVDRVSIQKAIEYVKAVGEDIDIVEVGTSLIKDYGLVSVKTVKEAYPHKTILADMKVMDEGEYEFTAAYRAGADSVTVMGAASLKTIAACKKVANDMGKDYMIDLLEVDENKLDEIVKAAEDGVFCVHLPSDRKGQGLWELIEASLKSLKGVRRLAVAGGVSLDSIGFIKKAGFEIVIVGSAITGSEDMTLAARKFYQAVNH